MYTADYTAVFPRPQKTAIYNASITGNKKLTVQARKEATHKAHLRDFTTHKAADM